MILVEDNAKLSPSIQKILKRLEGVPVKMAAVDMKLQENNSDMDKNSLKLISFPGEFFKPCPGTKGYICCGYQILHVGTNCPFDCSYCILQAYFNQPSLRIFVNLEEKLSQIAEILDRQPAKFFRIGTGEFTDSLALDPIAGWSHVLIPFISKRKNAVLELKTKSDQIEGLLSASSRKGVVVSWSLNSPQISSREEHGAPGIEKRLKAAKRCQEEGFKVGFHFDPLIQHSGWMDGYKMTLEMMTKYLDPKNIVWLSLGGLRFMPSLKSRIRKRHRNSRILAGEFVPGLDGKMRYFKPVRIEMYAYMAEMLRSWHGDLGLYLCMESDDVWEKGLGWSPETTEGLSQYLDRRALKFFGCSDEWQSLINS
jgi:spore photoproduct lyase